MANKLTDWEVGQDIIFISDTIGERSMEFKESHPELWNMLHEMRLTIGDKFNRMGTHGFGLMSHDSDNSEPPKDQEARDEN